MSATYLLRTKIALSSWLRSDKSVVPSFRMITIAACFELSSFCGASYPSHFSSVSDRYLQEVSGDIPHYLVDFHRWYSWTLKELLSL